MSIHSSPRFGSMNGHKAAFVVILGALSLGAMTVLEPRVSAIDNRGTAAVLGPVYAPAVEQIETLELGRGQTLSALLMRASITGADLAELLRALRPYQSPGLLNAGLEVTIRKWAHTGEARGVDLRMNRDTTLRLARQDQGWTTEVAVTPTVIDTVFVSGEIEAGRSLYESIALDTALSLPLEERIQLVSELVDIYEYKIDFIHEIQPGDSYAFAYEREARPDGTSRSNRRILVARLTNRGTRYDAVLFRQPGIAGYYDLEGKSLRRGFRRYPMDYIRITSSFNFRRYHPVLGVHRAHLGTDFGAPTGTRVRTTGDGTVIFAGRDGGYGNLVIVRHVSGYTTRYAHLSRFGANIRAGKRVMMDDVVGYVGMTGLASGPHLHYELRQNNRAIDFSKANLPGSPPLPNKYRADYRMLQKQRLALLEEGMMGVRFAKTRTVSNPLVGGGI
jgi:murein DD-endopeptidase MepM/ murein hydrolase activator NlpD